MTISTSATNSRHDPAGATANIAWQQAVRTAVRDPGELCRLLALPDEYAAVAMRAGASFPLFAPREFIARMRPGDPRDPLLLQVLPAVSELETSEGFTPDPVNDGAATVQPGLLHKYQGRALMVTTGACAVHCRYCFRRHYPYGSAPRSLDEWQPALEELAADCSIHEVLLSGGDPLSLTDRWLGRLAEQLAGIEHVRRLRIHTRLPIVVPQRICEELLNWLCGTRLVPVVVVHVNHPAEIDSAVAKALGRLIDAGVPVLNQAVLLRDVNDSADVLAELCERLVDLRVMPYYLHQLDRVSGAAHFEVPVDVGRRLVAQLHARLPGYAVPRYVQEVAGRTSKVPL
jgi:EF-P beta-lysylation protein EpmB